MLVRFYGGNALPKNNPIRTLNETSEALLFLILGQKGLGPQFYGCFTGGRIEEFIPSRILTVTEFASCDQVNQAIATIVARYHCLEVPVRKTPWNVPFIIRNHYNSYKTSISTGLVDKLIDASLKDHLKDFLHFDVLGEIEWIEGTLPKINSRVVFTHNDINRSNILLRTRDKSCNTVTSSNRATAATTSTSTFTSSTLSSSSGLHVESGGNNNNQGCNYNPLPSTLREKNKSLANESINTSVDQVTAPCQQLSLGDSIDKQSNGDDSLNDLLDRLLLVDYEFSGYNYRGIDIGNHFSLKVTDFGSDCFLTGLPYPSEKDRRTFVRSYINQVRLLGTFQDWDESGLDSEEHILMEAEFGALIRRLSNISGCLANLETWISIAAKRSTIDPSFKNGRLFSMFVSFYQERKAAFLKQWPQFASTS